MKLLLFIVELLLAGTSIGLAAEHLSEKRYGRFGLEVILAIGLTVEIIKALIK